MDLKGYKGFAILQSNHSIEALQLEEMAANYGFNVRIIQSADETYPDKYIPFGNVGWVCKILNKTFTPEYYPEWCKDFLYRKVWKSDTVPTDGTLYIKSATTHADILGKRVKTSQAAKLDKWDSSNAVECWCSDKVTFVDEFRYFVTNGSVITAGIIAGSSKVIPELSVSIPNGWCGILDFGHLSTGEFALVKADYPFACDTYRCDIEQYVQWIIDGWSYFKNN